MGDFGCFNCPLMLPAPLLETARFFAGTLRPVALLLLDLLDDFFALVAMITIDYLLEDFFRPFLAPPFLLTLLLLLLFFAAFFLPPFFPPFLEALRFSFFPRPEPLFLPPPDSLFTVAQARDAASSLDTPRFS
jgi:hypothetical protein